MSKTSIFSILLGLLIIINVSFSSFISVHGYSRNDWANRGIQDSNGEYFIAGTTYSFGNPIYQDIYLARFYRNGSLINDSYFPGGSRQGYGVVQTDDGNYVVIASSDKFSSSYDFVLIKMDENFTQIWNKTYGGSSVEVAEGGILKLPDGGFLIAGRTNSYGAGVYDVYIVRTDENGTLLWNKTYGGSNNDLANDIINTSDGNFLVIAYTSSFGAGGNDFYVLKIDENGTLLWNKTYGTSNHELAYAGVEDYDGNYVIVGYGDGNKYYVIKIDSNGSLIWQKSFSYGSVNYGRGISISDDGNYMVAGYSLVGSYYQIYLIKLDKNNGNVITTKTYGGSSDDYVKSMIKTRDSGFLIIGNTNSYGAGQQDLYLIKTDENGDSCSGGSSCLQTSVIANYHDPTPANDSSISESSITQNATSIPIDTYIENLTLNVFDGSGTLQASYTCNSESCYHKFDSLNAGTYYINAVSCDNIGVCNTTENRTITIVQNDAGGNNEKKKIEMELMYGCAKDPIEVIITHDGKPVEDVKVILSYYGFSYPITEFDYTNEKGYVKFIPEWEGKYRIKTSKNDYKRIEEVFYINCGNELTNESEDNESELNQTDTGNEVECYNNNDCEINELCVNNTCNEINCECGYISNHECVNYECCEDAQCNENQYCSDLHKCEDYDIIIKTNYTADEVIITAKYENEKPVKNKELSVFTKYGEYKVITDDKGIARIKLQSKNQKEEGKFQLEKKRDTRKRSTCMLYGIDLGEFLGICWYLWLVLIVIAGIVGKLASRKKRK